jgi:SAM-dependent methyltransferase
VTRTYGPRTGDAFGRTLQAVLDAGEAAGTVTEIVERDDGLIVAADAQRYFRPEPQWSEPVRWAVRQAAGRVLDVGVGAGRHALVAQAAGCTVTGLDSSAGAVRVARRRGVRAVRHGSVAQVADLFPAAGFDTVFMLGQNLALLGSPEQAGGVLRALHRVTAPGAVLIGDSADPTHDPDGHRDYYELNRSRGWWPGQMTLRVRHQHWATEWFAYFFCSPSELGAIAGEHGWELDDTRTKGANYAAVLRRAAVTPRD